MIKVHRYFFLFFYLTIFRYLPASSAPYIGPFFRWLRYLCCKPIFKSCGKNVNIERMAFFGSGLNLVIDDNSGLGINCVVPSDIIIGKNVMMGPNVHIFSTNHQFDNIDIPMIEQGNTSKKQCIIEDDVWIGRQVIFTPGRHVKKGSIIGAGTVLCRNFDEYSIIGGNPSVLIRSRKK
ncbi:maltose acetyltransferase [Flavobacterium sp. YO64]|nr:maltose acetyltransferase [Flavobacterium sp. YO64]